MERIYSSITHGKLTEQQVFEQIKTDIIGNPDTKYKIVVGTDSQTYDVMRVVPLIALIKIGKGGKWFHRIEERRRTFDIREKIYHETQQSLDMAKSLTSFLYENNLDFQIVVAVDMGENPKGKTHVLIREIVGWVTSEGFECTYKPNSTVASTIADRLSK
jgi:predicted RNase H-related nuclease YkuK (DUF458 family)